MFPVLLPSWHRILRGAVMTVMAFLWVTGAVHAQVPAINLPNDPSAGTAESVEQTDEAKELQDLLRQLDSDEFKTRAAASEKLARISNRELQTLAELTMAHSSAEVVVRLMAEIDRRYVSGDPDAERMASAALESLAETSRQLMAEGANQSLRDHWYKRVEIAAKNLEQLGAVIRYGSFLPSRQMGIPPEGGATLQIMLNKDWRGGDAGLELFRRLSAVAGPLSMRMSGVNIYLIDGNPLTPDQKARLTEYVGQNRIAERSRAALGIKPGTGLGQGVFIQTVTSGSSAEAAGIRPGDLILGVVNEEKAEDGTVTRKVVPIQDFDDLVDRLKSYDKGDVMKLQIVGGFRTPFGNFNEDQIEPRVVDVLLKGWEDLDVTP
ncbi:MAG: PDZ domain-containing protein [Planctomycetaceae bacterium]|nr:PDZ domain-containing protein [Planctomycetaceae bacterium]